MRTIKIIFCVLLYFSQAHLLAATTQVQVGSQVTQTTGQVTFDKSNFKKYSGQISDVQVTSPRLNMGMQITAAIKQLKNDYSDYLIQDESGNETSLKKSFDQSESFGSVNFDWVRQNHNLALTHDASLTSTPFPSRLTQLSYALQLNDQLTILQWKVGTGVSGQPKSFFTDLTTAERKQRASQVELRSYMVSGEQVVNSRMRVKAQLELNQKTDRPASSGVLLKSSMAISDRDFLRFDLARHDESRKDRLQDERGYFNLNSAEMTYSRYVTYDLTLSAGYGLIVEKEDNPQTLRKDQMASDVYSLGLTYQSVEWTAGFKIQELVSNLNYSASVYGGQFSWNF